MTRTSGSVPLARSSTRPLSPSSAVTAATASVSTSSEADAVAIDVAHVDEHLRVDRHDRGELGEGLALSRHLGHEVQARQQAVAGRGVVAHDDVAGLLAAERVAALVHRLEHVAVADGGLEHADALPAIARCRPRLLMTVATRVSSLRLTALLHRHGDDRHDLVAVDDLAGGVHGEAAVGVAVVGDADVGPDAHDMLGERVEVGRADAVVDVHAVRVGADHGDAGAGIAEGLGRDSGCRAVRAVEHDVDAVEAMRQRGEQVEDVAVLGVGEARDAADAAAGRLQLRTRHGGFDALLDHVGELDTAAGEDLDAVVGGGIVGCRDHDAEVGVDVGDQERRGGRRQQRPRRARRRRTRRGLPRRRR